MKRSWIVGFVALMLWVAPAFGQGCAMCYSSATATSKDGLRAINKAVLIMMGPTVGFMTIGFVAAFRYSRKRDEDQDKDQDNDQHDE
jgi:heme/copper-type cytochrome/quinol oxidase subunit 2